MKKQASHDVEPQASISAASKPRRRAKGVRINAAKLEGLEQISNSLAGSHGGFFFSLRGEPVSLFR
jgi:hypothetical protein